MELVHHIQKSKKAIQGLTKMAKSQNGWIELNNGTRTSFQASSPKKALITAQKILKLRSLTRRTLDKVNVRSIHFGNEKNTRIIYPIKHKRTLCKHRDKQSLRDRPACSCKHLNDIGRKRHTCGRIAA